MTKNAPETERFFYTVLSNLHRQKTPARRLILRFGIMNVLNLNIGINFDYS